MWGCYRRWPRFKPILLAVCIAAVAGWVLFRSRGDDRVRLAAFSEPAVMLRAGQAEVIAVIDGETLLLKQPAAGPQREFLGQVRLLGISQPEKVRTGEAVVFLKKLTESGLLTIELDKRRVDRDGLFLAYVYAGNLHLSEELVAAGLARVQTYPGDSMSVNRKLLAAQDAAKREARGNWQK